VRDSPIRRDAPDRERRAARPGRNSNSIEVSLLPATLFPLTRRARRGWLRVGAAAAALTGSYAAACSAAGATGADAARPARALAAAAVVLESDSGVTLRGWLARGRPGGGAVLLLHGVGSTRLSMVARARFLRAAGYTVLLPDLRAHGESEGGRTTFGAAESRDARAALALLRARAPGERVAVIGVSMGGAASLLGDAPLVVDAMVLESVYPTIDEAVVDRARAWLGPFGAPLAPAFVRWYLPRATGVRASDLRPIDRIGRLTSPVLLLAGTADRYTRIAESRRLFARAPEPKELWEVEGATHEDLHAFAPAEYERRILAFLARHLRAGAVASSGAGAAR
jgi:alpha-beta hydrolase superfamily lysophospholipase